jgi:uncharacterized repeat protein (TIGR03943 family)
VNPIDRSRAALATGILALWMGLTDAMLKYLRPSMRPWLVAAGVGLVGIGVYGLVRARQLAVETQAHDHTATPTTKRRPRIGWLLVTPVVAIILFGPQPMGDFALRRTPHLPEYAFDIAAYASSSGQRIPALKMSDFLEGAVQSGNREYLASHDVMLRGFVSLPGVAGPGSFVLTRYLITCCAADAQPLSVTIVGASSVPDKNQWLDVTARYEPTIRRVANGDYGPVLRAQRLQPISTPSGPYESLR